MCGTHNTMYNANTKITIICNGIVFSYECQITKRINLRGALLKRVIQSTPLTSAQRLESIILYLRHYNITNGWGSHDITIHNLLTINWKDKIVRCNSMLYYTSDDQTTRLVWMLLATKTPLFFKTSETAVHSSNRTTRLPWYIPCAGIRMLWAGVK